MRRVTARPRNLEPGDLYSIVASCTRRFMYRVLLIDLVWSFDLNWCYLIFWSWLVLLNFPDFQNSGQNKHQQMVAEYIKPIQNRGCRSERSKTSILIWRNSGHLCEPYMFCLLWKLYIYVVLFHYSRCSCLHGLWRIQWCLYNLTLIWHGFSRGVGLISAS